MNYIFKSILTRLSVVFSVALLLFGPVSATAVCKDADVLIGGTLIGKLAALRDQPQELLDFSACALPISEAHVMKECSKLSEKLDQSKLLFEVSLRDQYLDSMNLSKLERDQARSCSIAKKKLKLIQNSQQEGELDLAINLSKFVQDISKRLTRNSSAQIADHEIALLRRAAQSKHPLAPSLPELARAVMRQGGIPFE